MHSGLIGSLTLTEPSTFSALLEYLPSSWRVVDGWLLEQSLQCSMTITTLLGPGLASCSWFTFKRPSCCRGEVWGEGNEGRGRGRVREGKG